MNRERVIFIAMIAWLAWLIAMLSSCGTLSIQLEPLPTALRSTPDSSASAAPGATFALPTPTSTQEPATPTEPNVATETPPAISPVPTLAPAQPLVMLQTHMSNSLEGWGIGEIKDTAFARILYTSDGGWSWLDRTPPVVNDSPPEAFDGQPALYASGRNAWVTYSPGSSLDASAYLYVWRTTDAGRTWRASHALDFGDAPMEFRIPSDLAFLDAQHGWLMVHLGAGMSHDYIAIFVTNDGGANWQRVLDPNSPAPVMACGKSGLAFTTPQTGWLAGDCPGLMPGLFFYQTQNGGTDWKETSLPVPEGKPADYFSQEGSNVGCGISAFVYSAQNTLLLTLQCSNFSNNTHQAWLYATQDNGRTWDQHLLPMPYGHISAQNPDQAILIGAPSGDNQANGAVFSTQDGGLNWVQLASTGWTGLPDFINTDIGWVTAQRGAVRAFVHTTNGGGTWEEIQPLSGP